MPKNSREHHTWYTETRGQNVCVAELWTIQTLQTVRRSSYRQTHTPHCYEQTTVTVTSGLKPQTNGNHLSRPSSGKDQRTQRPYLGPSHLSGRVSWGHNKKSETPPFNVDQGKRKITGSMHLQGVFRGGRPAVTTTTIRVFWGVVGLKEDLLAGITTSSWGKVSLKLIKIMTQIPCGMLTM